MNKQTRKQPVTITGNNINHLRKQIYKMFIELVPGKYEYYQNGDVMMRSLPIYQCGGDRHRSERTFIPKDRDLSQDEVIALEVIANRLRHEGVTTKLKNGKVHGLRLKIKPRREPLSRYTTNEVDQLPLKEEEKKYVVTFKSDNTHFILSKSDIENKISIDRDFVNNIDIFELGSKVRPKIKITL